MCGLGLPLGFALMFLGMILRIGFPPLDLCEFTVEGLLDLVDNEEARLLLNLICYLIV